jgi:hypothetical protein
MSDNYRFDIAGGNLADSLQVAFLQHSKVVGWRVDTREGHPPRFILYTYKSDKMTEFPAPMTRVEIEPIVRSWLESIDYGHKPDIDGSVGRSQRVYNESWGHVGGEWAAFVAIEPYWNLYGK